MVNGTQIKQDSTVQVLTINAFVPAKLMPSEQK